METSNSEPDWSVAKKGLILFLNNKPQDAEKLFAQRPDSFHIKTARCYMYFMNALMTFEDEKLQQSLQLLKSVEQECNNDIGWIKSMTKVFKTKSSTCEDDFGKKLERQIVFADIQLCTAMLVVLQQEVSSYIRAGWMIRKAWRVYQHTYLQIFDLYRRTFGINPSGFNGKNDIKYFIPKSFNLDWSNSCNNSPTTTSTSMLFPFSLRNSLSMIFSFSNPVTEQNRNFIEPSEVIRLMSAVSFGYGIFQLVISFIPSSFLKFIHLLGFETDRRAGLTALMYARLSEDMRAPLATLSLLAYHTIIRPFCLSFEWSMKTGIDAPKQLIAECQPQYRDAALFLFFSGRIERLQCNIDGALSAYYRAIQVSTQKEIQLLCLHEIAWCHIICLNYLKAQETFTQLQKESRWCESIYAYLTAICAGVNGKCQDVVDIHKKISKMTVRNTPLDLFVSRRVIKLLNEKDESFLSPYYKMLLYEVLYLWNAMSSCSNESLQSIIEECKENGELEPMLGLSNLLMGAAYLYLGEKILGKKCFQQCMNQRISSTENLTDQHISSFASYELGHILCSTNNAEEGINILTKIQSQYSNYDFESRLKLRIHSTIKTYS